MKSCGKCLQIQTFQEVQQLSGSTFIHLAAAGKRSWMTPDIPKSEVQLMKTKLPSQSLEDDVP